MFFLFFIFSYAFFLFFIFSYAYITVLFSFLFSLTLLSPFFMVLENFTALLQYGPYSLKRILIY